MAISPDSKWITANLDNVSIGLWSFPKGKLLKTPEAVALTVT